MYSIMLMGRIPPGRRTKHRHKLALPATVPLYFALTYLFPVNVQLETLLVTRQSGVRVETHENCTPSPSPLDLTLTAVTAMRRTNIK